MSLYSNNPDGRLYQPYAVAPAIDLELRSFMLRVFNTMAGGLALTGIVAYCGGLVRSLRLRLLAPRCSGW